MTSPAERAGALHAAMKDRTPIAPFTDDDPEMTAADAYAVQQGFVDLLLGESKGRIIGYKLGLTSEPMQQMLGVDEPDYGPVLSTMVFENGATVDLSRYIQPRVEAEIALVLDCELRGPGVTTMQAARAVGGAAAAIEMVDSRIADWKIKLADTISDLASSAATVLGSRAIPIDGWDPRLVGMVVSRNGQTVDTGAGAAAMGNPVTALAWLANTLAPYDVALEPGWLIMTGALHRAFPIETGDVVRADFDRLGSVTMRFE